MGTLRAVGRGLLDLLREIADQNAYERYLKRAGAVHSPPAWRAFYDARLQAKYRKAKCC